METPQHAIAPEEPTVSVQPPHVLVLPTEGVADHVATQLREEGFDPVEVGGGPDGWTVRIIDSRLPDADGGGAVEGLKTRFRALAEQHQGTYIES